MTSETDLKEIQNAESTQLESDDNDETPPGDIVAFNELRSCADLLRMHKSEQLRIKPDFQRDVVWPKTAQTRFIDSLVKQLPIPSMCISLDYNSGNRLMIDGLQRIWSVIEFLSNDDFVLSKLSDVDPRISGRSVKVIKEKHYDIYSRVENLTIPITVLRCDYSKRSHMEYLFTIFHRLNTGGNKLSNQEIRNCIYEGRFNDALKRMAQSKNFREAFGLEPSQNYRFQYEEFILRVFAMESKYEDYNGKLSKFLNEYMESNRSLSVSEIDSMIVRFDRVVSVVFNKILGRKKFPKISRTTIEALFVATMRHINDLESRPSQDLKLLFKRIREAEEFSLTSLKEGLAHRDKLQGRLSAAIKIAASI